MKPIQQDREVLTVGVSAKKDFTVKVGAHIMRVLSNLYTNPVEAIVREYLSNMYDAYVPLIKTGAEIIPPVVRLPGVFRTTLEFQDFGVGMDFDTVWSVYSQYGNSTKSDTNDEIGGFGLGSKAAFCYNGGSAWNIIACKGGVRNTFMACVGPDGIPVLSHVGKEVGDFPNGVTISIPILSSDVDSVRRAVEKFAPHFELPLLIDDKPAQKISNYAIQGNGWGVLLKSGYAYASHPKISMIMGTVPYLVPPSEIDIALKRISNKKLISEDAYWLRGSNSIMELFIRVPIGSMEITPSRDSLQWTDITRDAFVNALVVVHNEAVAYATTKMQKAKTVWEAATLARDFSLFAGLRDLTYKSSLVSPGTIAATHADASLWKKSGIKVYQTGDTSITPVEVPPAGHGLKTFLNVPTTSSTLVFINDTKYSIVSVMREHVRNHFAKLTSKKTLARWGHTATTLFVAPDDMDIADIQKLVYGIPETNIIRASSCRKPRASFIDDKHYIWTGSRFQYRKSFDTSKPVYYVVLKKSDRGYVLNNHNSNATLMGAYNTLISALDIDTGGTIYGVRDSLIHLVPPKAINLTEEIDKQLKLKVAKHRADILSAFSMGQSLSPAAQLIMSIPSTLASTPELIQLKQKLVSSTTPTKAVSDLMNLISACRLLDNITVLDKIAEERERIRKDFQDELVKYIMSVRDLMLIYHAVTTAINAYSYSWNRLALNPEFWNNLNSFLLSKTHNPITLT